MKIDLKNIQKNKNTKKETENSFWSFLNKDIHLFGSKMKDKQKERFYSDLNILLVSGIDIKTTLELICAEQRKKSEKELFEKVTQKVVSGSSLSEALYDTGKFSEYEYFSLKIGEESGRITEVLKELTLFYSKKIKQSRQIVNAFSYPSIVVVVAFTAVLFMMNFVVPMFVDVFIRFNGKLPALTQMVINASNFVSDNILYFLILIMFIVIFILNQRKKTWFRRIFSKIILRLPGAGKIVRKIYVARFCQAMALLISSRTPMLRAIELTRKMIGFYPFEVALATIESDILHGKALYESMRQFKLFDNRITSLVKVAEEVNQLETIFDKLNKQYSEELEHQIGLLSSTLEPLMIILVGIFVGIILISMYLPLFQLSTSVFQ